MRVKLYYIEFLLVGIIAPYLHSAEQVAFWFVNMYENFILTRDRVLVMIMCSEASEDCVEGLETKVSLRANLVALVKCLAGIDYKILELIFDDLVMGSRLCPWSSTVTLHVLLNLGVEATLMCLDSLRLSSCVQTPHIGSSISAYAWSCEIGSFPERTCVFVFLCSSRL
ncbi:hypothetical protein M9H77_35378 [Catharanthus roseus]|uniref:Uncharacterized protein n=1 Tax=Catharanthus roseus TaxID=4058 RepID=A0ACB9ZQR2_CATRO|nr:hypothetical protein M9H77_35378 [Catharanthus roseus]